MIDNPNGDLPTTKPAWSILRIEDQTAFTPGKGAVRVKRVWYTLFDGTESYEDFPASSFDESKVEKKIDDQAQTLARVLRLQGADITLGGS